MSFKRLLPTHVVGTAAASLLTPDGPLVWHRLLRACMCVRACVCTCEHAHMCVCDCMHVRTRVCMHAHVCMCVCVTACMCARVCACMHMCACVHACVCMCDCMCVHVRTCARVRGCVCTCVCVFCYSLVTPFFEISSFNVGRSSHLRAQLLRGQVLSMELVHSCWKEAYFLPPRLLSRPPRAHSLGLSEPSKPCHPSCLESQVITVRRATGKLMVETDGSPSAWEHEGLHFLGRISHISKCSPG